MEYIEGATLETKLTGTPLPLAEILSIASETADALDAAHARGIVHRDIKPANLMIDVRNHVKVLDFGAGKNPARGWHGDSIVEPAGDAVPDERRRGVGDRFVYEPGTGAWGRDVDHRTDLFSLGIVMYQMASGQASVYWRFCAGDAGEDFADGSGSIGTFELRAAGEFERIVKKCLEKDRERRYQSARELLSDLRSLERVSSGVTDKTGEENAQRQHSRGDLSTTRS